MVEISRNGASVVKDIGEAEFNARFDDCPVVQYNRNGNVHSVYKRILPIPSGFNAYQVFTYTWASANNKLNVDFEIYDSLADLESEQGKWKFCNYDDPDVGYPRDCGKTNAVWNTWFSMPGGRFNARGLTSGASFQLLDDNCPILKGNCKRFYSK